MKKNFPIGQGHGVDGRYAGLPDPYGEEAYARIVVLPVPFDKTTTYKKGSDKGPEAIIEASRNIELYDIETKLEVYKRGIFTDKPIIATSSIEMLTAVHHRVQTLLDKDKFVVTLGGEHSIAYAPIKAHAEKYGKLTVVQFDAHADLQPAYEGDPWSHASAMARVREIPGVEKIISVGIRSMSIEETEFIDDNNTFYAHQLDSKGQWIDQVLQKLEGPIYITFDLDAFDPSIMPSTGTPEPGGLCWNDTLHLLRRIASECHLVGLDLVELCPNAHQHAPDYLAAKLLYKILSFKEWST